jgi:transcriptional regulator with XRE-family HTH domain
MRFRQLLVDELARRCARNRRYSLRAFARFLGTDHSTLSQLLRGRRRLTRRTVLALGRRLGLSDAVLARCGALEDDHAVLHAVGLPSFQPDTRWLAMRTGLPIDEVNVSLHRLLHGGALTMVTRTDWRCQGESCRTQW